MSIKKEKTKEQRISAEIRRLKGLYTAADESKQKACIRLIERAAFLTVTLEDLERDLNANGVTEMFQQSEKCDPYARQRPESQTYDSKLGNYLKTVKELREYLPDDGSADASAELLEFMKR